MDNNRIAYIDLFGVVMSGVRKPDQGLYWTDLKGWWGLPDLRGDTDNIPGAHGRFTRVTYLRESRVITLTGHILAKTDREFMAVRDRLETALSIGGGDMHVVTDTYGSWRRFVEIDTLSIEPDYGKGYTKFTVDMVAPDPRRYGPMQMVGPIGLPQASGGVRLPQRMPWNFGQATEASRIIIHNTGSIPVFPTFMLDGGFSVASVINVTSGLRLTLDRIIPEGSTVILDSGSRRATLGSADFTRWLTRRQWFEIEPGASHEFRLEATEPVGEPRLRAQFELGAW